MLTWQGHVRSATVMLFRMEHRNTAYATLGQISAMIRSFIVGNVVIGAFMAVLSVLFFGLMGLPYFYFVGIISGFLSLVPYLGVVLALLPPLLSAMGVASGAKVAAIVGVVLVLHLFALNVLYPKILGRRLQLNPLVVTIALLTWGWIWGAMGLILAVPIVGAIKIIFDHVDSLRPYGAWMGE
jgi:predicted PurR-regulated permease PerM